MSSAAGTSTAGTTLVSLLERARARLRLVDVLRGAALGFLLAAVVAAVSSLTSLSWWLIATISMVCAAAAAIANVVRNHRALPDVADALERREPTLHNLLRTAAELLHADTIVSPTMRSLVFEQAALRSRTVDVAALLPSSRPLALALLSALFWMVLLWARTPAGTEVRQTALGAATRTLGGEAFGEVSVTVTPPSYSGVAQSVVSNPDRIQALRGSRLHVDVQATRAVELIQGTDTIAMRAVGTRNTATITLQRDGFIVLRAPSDSTANGRRLIGLSASEDRAPLVRITKPGRDLFLLDSTATIDVAIDASDDIALSSLRLRYTKVSGSGERFTFTEGDVPVAIQRSGPRQWTARGQLHLQQLGLAQGDMLVYRGAASDGQPGAAAAESDAFIVEIVGVGGDAAAGFSIDPEQDRYAVSQQMVILKTERLLAKRSQLPAEALIDASRELSMEQRRVRAEFVFMMGGELAEEITEENSMGDLDETHEAESESDLSAGRMANRGRAALLAAIRAMSRAATALNVGELDRALVHERTAVRELESAFSRTRYLLRAFTEREELDLSRRLSGNLEDARSTQRSVLVVEDDGVERQLRGVLDRIARASAARSNGVLVDVAEEVLAVDPSSRELQRLSAQLVQASRARAGSRERGALLDSVTLSIAARLGRATDVHRTVGHPTPEARRMEGVLRDALQRQPRSGARTGNPPDAGSPPPPRQRDNRR